MVKVVYNILQDILYKSHKLFVTMELWMWYNKKADSKGNIFMINTNKKAIVAMMEVGNLLPFENIKLEVLNNEFGIFA